jgi:UDP-N-acetylglucosamine 2-epimerase
MTVLSVVGARPQFIKAAPVSRALRARVREVLLHTGQHYDPEMSQAFFQELDIPEPDINLEVGSGTHAAQTGAMLVGIDRAIRDVHPDLVLVYGDTNSTLAAALAASKVPLALAHVEAGLRSRRLDMPEEVNRVVSDRLSQLLFAPTSEAVANLAAEGITRGVHEVGDVMYDAFLHFRERAEHTRDVRTRLGLAHGRYFVATVHRAENTDTPPRLAAILAAFARLDAPVIFPVHPRTRAVLARGAMTVQPTVRLIEPLGYLDLLALYGGAAAVLTDSGGVQKEAYWAGVPCITLRDETEWVETVACGWNTLAGADAERIVAAARTAMRVDRARPRPAFYGDGHAAERIAEILARGAPPIPRGRPDARPGWAAAANIS